MQNAESISPDKTLNCKTRIVSAFDSFTTNASPSRSATPGVPDWLSYLPEDPKPSNIKHSQRYFMDVCIEQFYCLECWKSKLVRNFFRFPFFTW